MRIRVPAAKHATCAAAAFIAVEPSAWLPALVRNVSDPRNVLPDPNKSSVLPPTMLSDTTARLSNNTLSPDW